MAHVAFIGLGNMGLPMAQNLIKAGHQVTGVDLSAAAKDKLKASGGALADSAGAAATQADVVVTMLPSGKEVRALYLDAGGIVAGAKKGALLIDSSTIDVESARVVA
jgi:3-hydroxyisobutyrate dehydrogenase